MIHPRSHGGDTTITRGGGRGNRGRLPGDAGLALRYADHGAKTVTLARFLPILRTFAPFVAGLGRMPYGQFLSYSVLGSLLWIGGLITLGYQFGNVPFIKQNLTLLILFIIGLSLLPMLLGWWHQRRQSKA